VAIISVGVVLVLIENNRISLERTRYSKARAQIAALQSVLKRYYQDNGSYPTTDQGLSALAPEYYVDLDAGMVFPRQPPRRLPLLDPWGRPYFYQSDGQDYVLESFGPDGSGHDSNKAGLIAHSPSPPR
jgi:general secretion pathway protein G